MYDRKERLIIECEWYNGIECDIEGNYAGDKSKPLNIGVKHLKLIDNCVLVDWDVSLLDNLESIEIGDECFVSVQTFQIDGLNRLKTIKIGSNSFTQVNQTKWDKISYSEAVKRCSNLKSFHILNCESLESIQIGECSYVDFGGDLELKNLPQLQSIQIGTIGSRSWNFWYSSFVIRGIDMILNI